MQVQLKEIGNHPVFAYRKYEILRDGVKVGTFSKGADRRWNAQMVRNRDEAFVAGNITGYAHSNYHAMIRLIACYLQGDMERVSFLARGNWTNPCPTAEVIS